MKKIKAHAGFTLIEIAIVLLIVTILIGYTVAMVPIQQELKQYRQAETEMDAIIENLIAFAQVNGRLPCPDTTGLVDSNGATTVIDGLEDTDDGLDNANLATAYVDDITIQTDGIIDGCRGYYGFLPNATLGLNGDINDSGQLLDPWGQPYRYHVSNVGDSKATPGIAYLVTPEGVRDQGLSNVTPDLNICDNSPILGNDLTCADAGSNTVVENVAAVVLSTGKDFDQSGLYQMKFENFDDFNDGYDDKVYIYAPRSDVAGAVYDDIVKWISPNLLYSKMIEAGQLP